MSKVFQRQIIFDGNGEAFSAMTDAENWLTKNGYSFGSSCVDCPQAILKGDFLIAKWRNLTQKERSKIDGKLHAGREGHATIVLKVK